MRRRHAGFGADRLFGVPLSGELPTLPSPHFPRLPARHAPNSLGALLFLHLILPTCVHLGDWGHRRDAARVHREVVEHETQGTTGGTGTHRLAPAA